MTLKFFAAGVAAVAVIGAAAAGATAMTATSGTSVAAAGTPHVTLASFGAPLPLDPAADVPSPDQLNGVLYGLADPNVPFASKSYLVEGGLGRLEARTADAVMRKAVAQGQMPLSFSIAGIAPAGPGAATATVTATGPATPGVTQSVLFVDQGGWKLSRSSASAVLAMFSS
ncbi:MAG TPA: hypothetical protein PLK19_07020 [Mycobacterium sp.]|nr:hypothetical protein [Mycobacterium sp.]